MHTLSPLQILPFHIIELIVDHVSGSSRLLLDGVARCPDTQAMLLLPLISVCRDFRAAVISRYSRVYCLHLNGRVIDAQYRRPLWPDCLRKAELPTHLFAVKLEIALLVENVYNGYALGSLSREPYVDFTFPKVRHLEITFVSAYHNQQTKAAEPGLIDVESNIWVFVRRLKRMAPLTKSINFTIRSNLVNEELFPAHHFGSLLTQLSRLAEDVEHHYACELLDIVPTLDGLRSLTHYLYTEHGGGAAFQLARNNASTLQSLGLYVKTATDMSSLFQNADGSYVQYPCLRALRLTAHIGLDTSQRPVFPGAVPFPYLRLLNIKLVYPFGDDTPFRGNAATLEDLALYVRMRTVAVLREYNVFTHVSHPRLQRVSVGKTADVVQANFNTDIDYMQLAMSIGPSAPVREVRGVLIDPTLFLVIPVLGEHTCIRVLVLPGIPLNLWDALGLVKALPLLSDLRTASPVLGRQPIGVSKHMLPAYIIENYAPRGERFRCWSIEYRCDLPVDEPVRCVLLLALACPNFDYAAVWSPSREKFMAHMKEVITTGGGFRPHKARLRRLLFGGSENEIPNTRVARARAAAKAEEANAYFRARGGDIRITDQAILAELAQMEEEIMEETH